MSDITGVFICDTKHCVAVGHQTNVVSGPTKCIV